MSRVVGKRGAPFVGRTMTASDVWSFYVLACGDGSLYAGVAKDVRARLDQHKEGKGARYTRGRGPLRLRGSAPCGTKGDALSVELRFKSLPRTEKVRLLARKTTLAAWVAAVVQARSATPIGKRATRSDAQRVDLSRRSV